MTTSTFVKSFAAALTAATIYSAAAVPAGATTITLTDHSNESDVTHRVVRDGPGLSRSMTLKRSRTTW
jgi:hypothetical protein